METAGIGTIASSFTSRIHLLLRWSTGVFRDLGASERNVWRAAMLVTALILFFQIADWAEPRLLVSPDGQELVGNAAEASTRYFTIPHIIVGFLFMISSLRNRTRRKRIWIAGLLFAGAMLCCAYEELLDSGGKLLASAFLYSYFLLHELKDELQFYRMLEDTPKLEDERYFRSFARAQIALLLVGTVFILWVSGTMRTPPVLALAGVPALGMVGIATAFGGCWLAVVVASYRWYAVRRGTSIVQVVRDHRRLIRLFTTIFLLTIVGAILTDRLYPIILLHVAVWYVFTCRALKDLPAGPTRIGTWAWMRGTLVGFRTLHIGLAVVCILLGLVVVYTQGPVDQVWWIISPEAFPYWTIMHVSLSLLPR
ncbi:MAG: hypothetical protein WD070_03070 [Pirellulaceae bacterium]